MPNEVPGLTRFFLGCAAITWTAWALVGLLSGHMFLLLSRGGPIHFFGLGALLFSAAVLLAVVLCLLPIVDHFDRRDNEAAYRRARTRIAYGAVLILIAAVCVGCVPGANELPASFGLLDSKQLGDLGRVKWLADLLAPLLPQLRAWAVGTFVWVLACGLVMKAFSKPSGVTKRNPVVGFLVIYLVLAPALAAFTLNLLHDIATGEVVRGVKDPTDLRPKIAWLYSMLVACMGMWLLILGATARGVVRGLRSCLGVPR